MNVCFNPSCLSLAKTPFPFSPETAVPPPRQEVEKDDDDVPEKKVVFVEAPPSFPGDPLLISIISFLNSCHKTPPLISGFQKLS